MKPLSLTNRYTDERYRLNPIASLVWQHCDGTCNKTDLVQLIEEQFHLPNGLLAEAKLLQGQVPQKGLLQLYTPRKFTSVMA